MLYAWRNTENTLFPIVETVGNRELVSLVIDSASLESGIVLRGSIAVMVQHGGKVN